LNISFIYQRDENKIQSFLDIPPVGVRRILGTLHPFCSFKDSEEREQSQNLSKED
jgi:hypothetical protein